MTAKVGDWCWHVHHGDGLLVERLYEPYKTRVAFIKATKDPSEIETRLRLFQPVRGTIRAPKYWREAYAKWQEADAKWREADAKWREADAKRREAYAKRLSSPSWKKVEALHRKECPDCPWNGETIFP